MTRRILGLFVLCAAVLLIAGPGMTGISSAADKVIEITIPAHIPPSYSDMFPPVKQFVDRVNELGKGKIKANLYHSESLYKVKDIVPALMNGSCEMIFHTSSHTTGSWPEIGGLNLPFLYKNNQDVFEHYKADGELMGLLNKEMARKYGVRVLGAGIMGSMYIYTTEGHPVTKASDLKGLKLRTAGKVDAELVKACGGSPLFLSSSETYEALQRGTIDGLVTFPGGLVGRNLDEVLRFGLDTGSPMTAWGYQIYVLNTTFNSWPEDVQKAILTAAREYDEAIFKSAMSYEEKTVYPRITKNVKILQPSPEDFKKLKEIGETTYPDWFKSVDKGFAEKFVEISRK